MGWQEVAMGITWLSLLTVSGIPKPEPPRPDWLRPSWVCLNGIWSFSFDEEDKGLTERWYEKKDNWSLRILVPFPWESALSGIGRKPKNGIGWYHRTFQLPKDWAGKTILLCFGAVDWKATVWVNGHYVGEHEGGYSEFRLNITKAVSLSSPNSLVVRVEDHTDKETPIGKQVEWWYTSTSGIWQTVWLEAVGNPYLQSWRLIAESDSKGRPTGRVTAKLFLNWSQPFKDDVLLTVQSLDRQFATISTLVPAGKKEVDLSWTISRPRFWSPETPHLYPVRLTLKHRSRTGTVLDQVETYFGLRDIRWVYDDERRCGILLLNGTPLYLRGALDQSFNPLGIYTAPSDDFLRQDIVKAKDAGFNMLRIHIKIDEPRKLYWADQLGILIQYDFPSFYTPSARARELFERTVYDAINRDFNHPSIYCWTIFNEEWGIGSVANTPKDHRVEWVEEMFRKVKTWDPTRLVQDNTGWAHLVTDFNSFHWYGRDVNGFHFWVRDLNDKRVGKGADWNFIEGRRSRGEPFVNNEFGYVAAGDGDGDWSWGVLSLINSLSACDRLMGYTYTELTDIEWEHNGVYNYDRSEKEFGFDFWAHGMTVRDLFGPDFIVLDLPAVKEIRLAKEAPTSETKEVVVPVLFRTYSGQLSGPLRLYWQWRFLDRFGNWWEETPQSRQIPTPPPFRVSSLGDIRGRLPQEPGILTLVVWLVDKRERWVHTNYTQWWLRQPDGLPLKETLQDQGLETLVYRFRPTDFTSSQFSIKSRPDAPIPGKHYGLGTGSVTYEIPFTEPIDWDRWVSLSLCCEISAKAGREKVDWPQRVNPQDYPQTDEGKKFPTTVIVKINDVPIARWDLPDDPADAQGVLSHWAGKERGSYGYLMRAQVNADSPQGVALRNRLSAAGKIRIVFEVPENVVHKGGLALYGAEMGCYPMDPFILLRFRKNGTKADQRQ
ncbi:MAG: hypothetical protein NZ959_03660 [Armatimonadetes bacterium]|nr:hypothetical protein [Armatimonadota bacterium]